MRAKLKDAIDGADEEAGIALAKEGLAAGLTPLEFFQGVIEPVLKEIGDAFARLDVFLPDLMRAWCGGQSNADRGSGTGHPHCRR